MKVGEVDTSGLGEECEERQRGRPDRYRNIIVRKRPTKHSKWLGRRVAMNYYRVAITTIVLFYRLFILDTGLELGHHNRIEV